MEERRARQTGKPLNSVSGQLIEEIKCTRSQKLSKSLRDYYYKQGDRRSCGENKCAGRSGGWEEVQGNRRLHKNKDIRHFTAR